MKRKILSAIAALGLALGLTAVAAGPAMATHPQVSGIGICNTQTGEFDVTWTVTSDPGYDASGTFVSASRLESQIVGKTVAGNGAAIDPKPTETVATNAPLSLTVGIQFSNHQQGDIVQNTGSAQFDSRVCEKPLPGPSGELVPHYADCESDGVAGNYSATLTLGDGTTATYSVDGVDKGAVTAGTYTHEQFGPGEVLVTLTGQNGQTQVLGPYEFVNITDESCIPAPPEPKFSQVTTNDGPWCYEGGGSGQRSETTTYYRSDPTWDDESKTYVFGDPYIDPDKEATVEYFDVGPEVCPFHVTPQPPLVTDDCGPGYELLLPFTDATGSYSATPKPDNGQGTITVTFTPGDNVVVDENDGYEVNEDGQAVWTFDVTNTACPRPPANLANTGVNPAGVVLATALLFGTGILMRVRARRENAQQ